MVWPSDVVSAAINNTAENSEINCSCRRRLSTTRCGVVSGTSVTFRRNSSNYCPNLMILSALWTEIICVQHRLKFATAL